MKRFFLLRVSLCVEFKTPKVTKVKAHKRIHSGRLVKVRSYFRWLRDSR